MGNGEAMGGMVEHVCGYRVILYLDAEDGARVGPGRHGIHHNQKAHSLPGVHQVRVVSAAFDYLYIPGNELLQFSRDQQTCAVITAVIVANTKYYNRRCWGWYRRYGLVLQLICWLR